MDQGMNGLRMASFLVLRPFVLRPFVHFWYIEGEEDYTVKVPEFIS